MTDYFDSAFAERFREFQQEHRAGGAPAVKARVVVSQRSRARARAAQVRHAPRAQACRLCGCRLISIRDCGVVGCTLDDVRYHQHCLGAYERGRHLCTTAGCYPAADDGTDA